MAIVGSVQAGTNNSSTNGTVKSDQTKNSETDTSYTGSTSGSTNTTTNSGSTNTSTNSGSVNTGEVINSGSTNTSTTSGSTNTSTKGSSTVTEGPTTQTTTTSDQVNTSQLLLTEEAVNYLVKGIMEGTSGLAATLSGGAQSGVYNSATTALLGNDLLARTAGEVAARAAVTRTVIGGTTSTTTNSGRTITDSGYSVTDILGGSTKTDVIGGSKSNSTTNIGGSTGTQNIGGSTLTEVIGGQSASGSSKAGSIEDIILNQATTQETKSNNTTVKAGWILCTELLLQGRMKRGIYSYGSRVFASYDEATRRGYYIWAIPALRHLKAHPQSMLSRFLCVMLNARAEYIAAEGGYKPAKKTTLGAVAKSLRWVCWAAGHTIARNYDYNSDMEVNNAFSY